MRVVSSIVVRAGRVEKHKDRQTLIPESRFAPPNQACPFNSDQVIHLYKSSVIRRTQRRFFLEKPVF